MNPLELFTLQQKDTLDLDLQISALSSNSAPKCSVTSTVSCSASSCYSWNNYVTCNCCV
ncbi:FDLD family class I lanthipeptide [Paenibacillus kribbensis]|uniref:FDLD family class I lanthipeptide n=1 Tax=Paenibacillus kribbensis TaxID=172713 RepID=UPI001C40011D